MNPTYLPLASSLIFLLIAAVKQNEVPIPLPPRARPFIALLLGQVYAVIEAMTQGMAWPVAVSQGLVAAALAISTHEVASKFPRPPAPPSILLVAALVSCAPSPHVRALTAAATVIERCEPALHEIHQRELDACPTRECVDDVSRAWEPVLAALETIRELWCSFSPSTCEVAK